jgi:lipid A 3-O-deacylase
MNRHFLLLLFLSIFWQFVKGQAIDNNLSYKNICAEKYVRVSYENDYFSSMDRYYTQGVNIEMVLPPFDFPLSSKILLTPKSGYTRLGVGLEHDIYTPMDISKSAVLTADRPFAACMMLKIFRSTIDPFRKSRFSTTLGIGILGPGAMAGELQTEVHRILPDNTIPKGWQNQIRNDLILSYQLGFEKQLFSYDHLMSMDWGVKAIAGTLNDKTTGGFTLIVGTFESPFDIGSERAPLLKTPKNNFHCYAYEHPEINLIVYDATIEGGLFNLTSPHTIDPSQMHRITFQNRFGFVVNYQKIYLEYFQAVLTSEFRTGDFHAWGGIQIAVAL